MMSDAAKRAIEHQLKRQAKKRRRKLIRRILLIGIAAIFLTAIIAAVSIFLVPKFLEDEPAVPTVPAQETVIELAFAGDLNVTDKVVSAGDTGNGYDYSEVLKDVLPLLAGSDQTLMNFEGNLCGAPYGTESSSAPPELIEALASAGVDFLQVANSCTINNGLLGLKDTLNAIQAAGIDPLGAYSSPEEFRQTRGFVLREIQGVKVAFVAFTKGMDNIALPSGQEDCVNLLYTDYTSTYQKVDTEGITALLRSIAAEEPDVTVALLHWGSEYNTQISKSQDRIVKLMKSEGVDVIMGTHPHHLQEVDFNEEEGTLVAYSLGDFWGDADRATSTYSAIIRVKIAKNDLTGQTRIAGFEYDPIYIYTTETEDGTSTKLLRIKPALEDYEANGVNAIPEAVYNAMKSADSRIEKLMTPKESD